MKQFQVDKMGREGEEFFVIRGVAFAFNPPFRDQEDADKLCIPLNEAYEAWEHERSEC